MAGIFNVAWKILRGALVASTEIVTDGGVAAKLEREIANRQRIAEQLESFIRSGPLVFGLIPTAAEYAI